MKSIEDKFYFLLGFYKKMPDWAKRSFTYPFTILPRSFYLGNYYKYFYEQINKIELLDKYKLEEFQFLKLKDIIKHSFETVPYYKKKWDELGINISQIQNFEDFKKNIPFIEKKDIQKNPELFISNKYSKTEMFSVTTGGSTGTPLKLYFLKGYTRSAYRAHWDYLWGLHGYKPGDRYARLRGDFIGKNKIYSFDPYRNVLILSSFALKEDNADKYLELLKKFKIKYLYGYPASIINLINYSQQSDGRRIGLTGVIFASENVYEYQVKKVKNFFNIDIFIKGYGLGEEVAVAVNQPDKNDYMFLPTHSYVEFHTNKNIPFNNDQNIKEIVGTSFVNPVMPLIRYRTNDFALIPSDNGSRIADIRPFLRVNDIIGRAQDVAIGKSGERITLTALIFGRHSEYFSHIYNFQIINIQAGKLIVNVVPKLTFKTVHKNEIISQLSEKEGMPFETDVQIVNDIEHSRIGKTRFLIRKF
ncbi:MAG: phenylacetate--CoA ligase family protein [Bacteroidales bacterium]|nr:phenylacetate--CoA ligase family protein [Bacteroidales bacterium]